MAPLSAAVAETARKNERAVLHALARISQTRVAESMGVSDSTITRLKDGGIEQAALLLAACGLKVVPTGMRCFREDKVHALLTLARDHLAQMHGPDQLVWEESAL